MRALRCGKLFKHRQAPILSGRMASELPLLFLAPPIQEKVSNQPWSWSLPLEVLSASVRCGEIRRYSAAFRSILCMAAFRSTAAAFRSTAAAFRSTAAAFRSTAAAFRSTAAAFSFIAAAQYRSPTFGVWPFFCIRGPYWAIIVCWQSVCETVRLIVTVGGRTRQGS